MGFLLFSCALPTCVLWRDACSLPRDGQALSVVPCRSISGGGEISLLRVPFPGLILLIRPTS